MQESTRYDHYEVLRRDDGSLFELGRGAMGITYKAFDTNLQCPVALKVINGAALNGEIACQRFVREARSAAQLRHRNVASVFHLGTEGISYFYAMEFIDGETVESLIRRSGPVEPVLALRIAAQVARALNAAQRHQLVHRDIKPANLMIVHEDDELVVKVIDFGLAKSSRKDEEEATLSMGGFVGTPHFASPEQLAERELDARSDLYSLGATLWYMLAGRAPFSGSIAQVMSQHLEKAPPFASFPDWPEPLTALLRLFLEKDPDHRPQTPNEARAAIERCLEQLSVAEEDYPTMVEAVAKSAQGGFAVGEMLAGRYRIVEDRGDTNAGRIFKATLDDAPVRIVQIKADLPPESFTAIERDVERLARAPHEHLLQARALESLATGSFLVFEWTTGFLLTELLRKRRELAPDEALAIVRQLAGAVDYGIAQNLKRLDLALAQARIHFPEAADESAARACLDTPVDRWPRFLAKANPISIAPELALAETWAGGQTVVGGLAGPGRANESFGLGPRYIQALAALTYELLGGATPALQAGSATAGLRVPPLAALGESGNEVLRKALDPAASFPTASAFIEDLSNAERGTLRRGTPSASAVHPPHRAESTVPPAAPPPTVGPTRTLPQPAQAAPSRPGSPLTWIIGIAACLLLAGAFFVIQPLLKPTPEERNQTAEPAPGATAPAVVEATPTPAPTPEPPPTPTPTPSRQDLMRIALEAATALESQSDWKACIGAYVALANDYPESDVGRVRLDLVLANLRATRYFEKESFAQYRPAVTEAATLDVVSAQMLLADQIRHVEPKIAFDWYCRAAAAGYAPAKTQVGLLYSNGSGVQTDLARAVAWFSAAASEGDAAGMTCLAECSLYGKGTPKDEATAIRWLRQAVAKEEPRALNLLGTCHHRGIGVPKDFAEALRLFTRATDLGHYDALGNLAVLYMNGEGVPKDPENAASLLEKGAKHDSPFCMFLYARCLENGIGIKTNRLAATSWYRKAASVGHAGAAEWCRKNGVPLR